jgi:hypothetical protein
MCGPITTKLVSDDLPGLIAVAPYQSLEEPVHVELAIYGKINALT